MSASYGALRLLTPNFDAEVKSYHGKASVWDSGNTHYLFSYGKLTAEIVEGDAGHKVLVYDFLKEPDRSPSRMKHKTILRHIAEFLHEFGYSADTFEEVKEFMPPARPVVSTPLETVPEEVIAKAPVIVPGKWLLHTHPRNHHDTWFTCSECGNLASADNGKDILTPFCPNCGKPMQLPDTGTVNPIASAQRIAIPEGSISESEKPTKKPYKRFTGWANFKPANAKVRLEDDIVKEVLINGKPHAIYSFSYGKWRKKESICISQLYFRHGMGRIMFTEIPSATASA